MSLTDSFLSAAKEMFMVSENIKRLEGRVDRVATEVAALDRRVMKIELMVELSKSAPRKRSLKELP